VARQLGTLGLFTLPAVVLWWGVWGAHPSSTMTCGCGDPAQSVWFTGWFAQALAHGHSPFWSTLVNPPQGANLLDNASSPLVGLLLAPLTWITGPVVTTNLALTLAPGLSAYCAWVAFRRFTTFGPGAVVGALLFGYAPPVYGSLQFGHVGTAVLVGPPLMLALLHHLTTRPDRGPRAAGLALGAVVAAQYFISSEVLALCLLLIPVGLALAALCDREAARARARHVARGLGWAALLAAGVLVLPVAFQLEGPAHVNGPLWALTSVAGTPLNGLVDPGPYGAHASLFVRFGGYYGGNGPPADYLGWPLLALLGVGLVVARRRALAWWAAGMALVSFVLGLGAALLGGPGWAGSPWLPWRLFDHLPLVEQAIPERMALFCVLFVALLLVVGLETLVGRARHRWPGDHRGWTRALPGVATVGLALLCLVPIARTYDLPLHTRHVVVPRWYQTAATGLPARTTVLSIPFPAPGTDRPMLWQADAGMGFALAGGGLKLPGPGHAPRGTGAPGSATRILEGLSSLTVATPAGTPAQVATVRRALVAWGVDRIVITGPSKAPAYAATFLTAVTGRPPGVRRGAMVWALAGGRSGRPAAAAGLRACLALQTPAPDQPTTVLARPDLAGPRCVLGAG
jgi:dolichyl-phosphate beta-glucosyltransferase